MRRLPFLSIVSCFLFFISCTEALPPVTRAEALKIADTIERGINAHRDRVLGKYLEIRLLTDRMRDLGSYDGLNAYCRSLEQKFNGEFLSREITQNLDKDGYKLLRAYEKDGQQHLLFRMISQRKFNYHDFLLIRTKAGIRIADCFVYITGENLSASLWETGRTMNESADILGRLSPENAAATQLRTLRDEGKFAEVKELIEKMDTAISNTRLVQINYITACQRLGDSIYLDALEKYGRKFPNASNLYMLMLDAYALNNNFQEALNAVDQLDSLVGGDPYLALSRSGCYVSLNSRSKAKQCLINGHRAEPGLTPIIETLMSMHAEDGERAEAQALFSEYAALEKKDEAFIKETRGLYSFLK